MTITKNKPSDRCRERYAEFANRLSRHVEMQEREGKK